MSQSLVENVVLLVITASLTGLLVPFIKNVMDNRFFERQKRYEADLARQGNVIEAQAAFLDDLSEQLWRFRYLAMAVSYYQPEEQPDRYQDAIEEYDKEAWDIFNHVRASISKARRLISENAHQRLVAFYKEELVQFDRQIKRVIESNQGHQLLNQLIFTKWTDRIDEIIHFLSRELELTSSRGQN